MNRAPAGLKGLYLETLTWTEAEPILALAPVVMLPIGARLKEHGHHLPLNNDWLMAEHLARAVLARVPVVALPTLQHHYYPAFVEYPGSVTLTRDTARSLVVEICQSLARFGPRRFYALNTGVSTAHPLKDAQGVLEREGIVFEFTNILTAAEPAASRVQEQTEGTHADELETSVMLHLEPTVVKMARALRDIQAGAPAAIHLTRDPNNTSKLYSPTGAYGDPTLATPEKGRAIFEAKVNSICSDIERLYARGPAAPQAWTA